MVASYESARFGKLPASASMAGACPMIVGSDGSGKYIGGDTLSGPAIRQGGRNEFVWNSRAPLSLSTGTFFKAEGDAGPAMLLVESPESYALPSAPVMALEPAAEEAVVGVVAPVAEEEMSEVAEAEEMAGAEA